MKAFSYIIAALAVPALVAHADDKAGVMEAYFPTADGTLRTGAEVRVVLDESLKEPVRKINENINKLTPEQKTALMQDFAVMQCPEYNSTLWPNRADYDEFVGAWNKTRVVPRTQVAVGLQKTEEGTWRVLSLTVDARTRSTVPLTLSALRYDADKNEWISNDGIMKPRDFTAPASSVYGAQTGTEWVLEKESSLTILKETLRVSRTTDGKYVYLAYTFDERSKVNPNTSLASGSYLLRFATSAPGANVGKPGQR